MKLIPAGLAGDEVVVLPSTVPALLDTTGTLFSRVMSVVRTALKLAMRRLMLSVMFILMCSVVEFSIRADDHVD